MACSSQTLVKRKNIIYNYDGQLVHGSSDLVLFQAIPPITSTFYFLISTTISYPFFSFFFFLFPSSSLSLSCLTSQPSHQSHCLHHLLPICIVFLFLPSFSLLLSPFLFSLSNIRQYQPILVANMPLHMDPIINQYQ